MAEPRTDRQQQTPGGREVSSRKESSSAQAREQQIQRRPQFDYGTSPFELMRRLSDQINSVFGTWAPFGGGLRSLGRFGEEIWSPQVEVFQREGKLVVRADLPGTKKDDVRVELRDDAVIIQGERREERKEDREGYFLSERNYGSFYRAIPLPEGTTGENARATFREGVLELTMDAPKGRQPRARTIQIEEAKSTR